jgi:hypothetical protein
MNDTGRPYRSACNKAIIIALAAFLLPSALMGQDSGEIDRDLMKRDLEIMESVLDRLLTPESRGNFGLSGSSASAFYLPGFGVMIEASGGVNISGNVLYRLNRDNVHGNMATVTVSREDRADSVHGTRSERDAAAERNFFYGVRGTGGVKDTISQEQRIEDIREKITSFLKNYAGVINQLGPDDRVAVIYSNRGHLFMPSLGSREQDEQQFRSLTVVARYSDLEAYRRGRLDDQSLEQNLTVKRVMSGDPVRTDLEIFGRILDTGLKTGDRESISIRGNVSRFHVDGVGALFNLQAGMSTRAVFSNMDLESQLQQERVRASEASGLDIRTRRNEEQAEQLRQQAREIEAMAKRFPSDTTQFNRQLNVIQARIESLFPDPAKFESEYSVFESNLKAYMVDYGRTLNSLNAGESLFISVSISGGRNINLPGRIIYKIDKDTIDRYDRRSINRDQAIAGIVKMEY